MSDQWFYGENGQQRGPVSLAALRDRAAAGLTRGDDLVWREGMANWTPAAQVPEIADALQAGGATQPSTPAYQPPTGGYAPPTGGYAPPTGYGGYGDPEAMRLEKSATTALTLGIVSIVTALCCAPVGIGLGIAAIVKGGNARRAPNAGTATAAVLCGIVGILLGVANLIYGMIKGPEQFEQLMRQINATKGQ